MRKYLPRVLGGCLLGLLLTIFAAAAIAAELPVVQDSTSPWSPLLALLTGKFGGFTALLAWAAAIKLAMTAFENQFARWIADRLNAIAASSDQDDDQYLREIFSAPSYRLISFLLRLIGFRFPTLADLERAIRLQHEVALDLTGASSIGEITRERLAARQRPVPRARALSLLLLLPLLCFSGCGTLDKSGVYQGDAVLYQAELATTTAYEVIHTYVSWEHENRAQLAHLPNIRKSADAMRRGAPAWFKTAHALHDAYKTDPSGPNKAALQSILSLLRAALVEAAGYMSTAATLPMPPNATLTK